MRLLDLFCGQGGASKGYQQAGLEIACGVDLEAPSNPRALRKYQEGTGAPVFNGDWKEGLSRAMQGEFGDIDLIHASPPCQRYSASTKMSSRDSHPDLVDPVRQALVQTGLPFVIENVPGAPLILPVYLTGEMFGLTVTYVPSDYAVYGQGLLRGKSKLIYGTVYDPESGHLHWTSQQKQETLEVLNEDLIGKAVTFGIERKRGFEVHGFTLQAPLFVETGLPTLTVVGGTPTGFWNQWFRATVPVEVKNRAMGTPWMDGQGVAESIPPAYTRYIGQEFLKQEVK